MNRSVAAVALASAGLLGSHAHCLAHVAAGTRVLPVTLTFNDPGTAADGDPGPTRNFGFEYDRAITANAALIINYGRDVLNVGNAKARTGFEDFLVAGKQQIRANAAHEFAASLGVIREVGGTGTTHTGAGHYSSTQLIARGRTASRTTTITSRSAARALGQARPAHVEAMGPRRRRTGPAKAMRPA